jgi:hypothetical protein
MKHFTEEELISFREGDVQQEQRIFAHVAECAACRAELNRIDAVLKALDEFSVPDPGSDYELSVWRQIAPRLPQKRVRWRHSWFEPRRLSAFGALAATLLAAFFLGRWVRPHSPAAPDSLNAQQVRERVLVVAAGDHLDRSEMFLVELEHAQPAAPGQKVINISAEQQRAEDLLQENRLYRQTAASEGDAGLASVLDELERVLVDIAHSPGEISPAQLQSIQKRIESRGILFKVRVIGKQLEQRPQRQEDAPKAAPQSNPVVRERNKA